ncbi:MAG: cation:proton antiporter [Polyangiaceae bacterium]|nr:cation:proton antiporter [Polyangiaceae bacterium]
MNGHDELLALLLLLGASVVGPPLAVRMRVPAAVVLILFGMALGPLGLGALHDTQMVAFVSELGFLLLMFMAGMEIDFEAIRAAGRPALIVPTLVVLGIFACAAGAGIALGIGGIGILVLSAMSVGMPLAVLKETDRASTNMGRHVMLAASIGELVCILAITGLEVVSAQGSRVEMLVKVGKVVLLLVGSALLIRWARAFVWWYPRVFRRLIEHHDVAELGVRVGLVVMLGFVVLAALAGVEPILGAFIGGSLVGFVLRQKHALEAKIAALGNGLFIPIFFIVVGLRFEASALDGAAVRSALMLALFAGLSKILPSLAVARRGTSLRDRFLAGCLLSAPLTLVVAIGSIGRKLELVGAREQASIVLVAMVVSIVFPIVFRLLARGPLPAS